MVTKKYLAAWLLLVLCTPIKAQATPEVVATVQSPHQTIYITKEDGLRCMRFSLILPGRQSCLDPAHPKKLVFEYTRTMMGALFLQPNPQRILIIGLGGGSLPTALRQLLPTATIDNVDIDETVAKIAQEYFAFVPDVQQRVTIMDGRAFVQRARQSGTLYDLIMLDAFSETYIPGHLLTQEFLQEVKAILAPGGVLTANTAASGPLYARESATYAAVFGRFYNLKPKGRVIIAARDTLPAATQLAANAATLATALRPFGIEAASLLPLFVSIPDWPIDTPVLIDRQAPVNLLDNR